MPRATTSTAAEIKALAREHGFALAGIAKIPESGEAPGAQIFLNWIAQGRHGPLEYLAETATVRAYPRTRFPWAKCVLSLGAFYDGRLLGERGRDLAAHIACYARGRDYHRIFTRRLKALKEEIHARGICARDRYCVDTGPMLERGWAQAAGLGWTGKNGCLIHPKHGSFLFLGAILLDAEVEADAAETDHCGKCRKCLDACPTQAFTAPGQIDANRCIVTWNVEMKGAVPPERWAEHHGWAVGCDICQTACPYNDPKRLPDPDAELAAPLPWQGLTLGEALELDDAAYDRLFTASAVRRAGFKGFRLGVITAVGSAKARLAQPALQKCLEDADEEIRARARWALEQLER